MNLFQCLCLLYFFPCTSDKLFEWSEQLHKAHVVLDLIVLGSLNLFHILAMPKKHNQSNDFAKIWLVVIIIHRRFCYSGFCYIYLQKLLQILGRSLRRRIRVHGKWCSTRRRRFDCKWRPRRRVKERRIWRRYTKSRLRRCSKYLSISKSTTYYTILHILKVKVRND